NDIVTVTITGLRKHETITDNIDGETFRGSDITLTAAEVDSGLTLHSNHWGGGQTTLAATATAKDPATGIVATSAPQTITVTDAANASVSQSHANHSFALLNQYL